jgi:hypothetical protein
MRAEQIRKELVGLKDIRRKLESELAQVRDDQAKLVKAADKSPEILMSEAAGLAGVSRVTAYDWLK